MSSDPGASAQAARLSDAQLRAGSEPEYYPPREGSTLELLEHVKRPVLLFQSCKISMTSGQEVPDAPVSM